MDELLKFCVIFLLIYGTEGQSAICDYRYQKRWTTGFKNTNVSDYKCNLNTRQANYDDKLISINGQHGAGHSDADVKLIVNYEDNKLKIFSSVFCQNYPNLEIIQINDAELESIDEDSLSNCKNLDQLRLEGNKIKELPEYLLIRNSKLTVFWVNNNQLTTLPENFFLNQKEFERLEVNENQINDLPSNIFRPLVKLEILYLYNNELESINPEWFINLRNLKRLSLGGNQISEIPSKCFASLISLEKLWIYDNTIKILNFESFDGLLNLQQLSLLKNEISYLPPGVFAPLENLQELSLSNNKLAIIHSDSFEVHNKLTKLWLNDNKINAVDPTFIDNIAVSTLMMKDNICSQCISRSRAEVTNNLSDCFANYRPRPAKMQSSCGRSVVAQGNIIGGNKIQRNSYPWIAALMRPKGQFFCGGTLVSNQKVLTAAHCILDKGQIESLLPRSVIVLLGFHDLSNSIEVGRVPYAVQSIIIHPDWNPYTTSYDADIAVLMLDQDVIFNKHIQPICMTLANTRIATLTIGIVVGNGKGGEVNEYENIPKVLKMPIQTARHCTEKDSTFQDLLTGRAFCAGNATGQGVCSGDSGGGFVVEIGNVFYLRGIVSASLGNSILGCDVNSFSVFTDALKYVTWINGL